MGRLHKRPQNPFAIKALKVYLKKGSNFVLLKRHSVVKKDRICLTRRFKLNSLSTHHAAEVVDFLKRILAVALFGSVVAGCTVLGLGAPEQVVQERAQQRWDELVKGDLRKAYGYLSPGSRSVMSPEAYESSIKRGFWKSAKVDKVECATPQSCDASVTIEYEFQGRRTKTPLRETWIKEGSEWWYLQK